MNKKRIRSVRWLLLPATLILGSACILQTAAGPNPTTQVIVVTATQQAGAQESQEEIPPTVEPEAAPTLTPTLTFTPTITPTSTPIPVTMTAGQDLSCVKGPHWILYEWVAKIDKGETVTLLARSTPEWPDYFYVRKANATECWAFGGSSMVTGDTSTLPVREAPPLPTVTYTIDNKTYLAVNDVYIRKNGESVWGPDRLGGSNIAQGTSFSLDITAGFYDVLIRDYMGGVLYEEYDRPIGSEANYHYTLLHNEVHYFIQNNYALNLCTISFKPHDGGAWTDLHTAADGPIPTGAKVYFDLIVGKWDIRIKDCASVTLTTIIGLYIGPTSIGHNVP
jgi:hypothetical protein